MVYQLETGVNLEYWPRLVAGARALVVSAALPIIVSIAFNGLWLSSVPAQGYTLEATSTINEGADSKPGDTIPGTGLSDSSVGTSGASTVSVASPTATQPAGAAEEVGVNVVNALPCGCPEGIDGSQAGDTSIIKMSADGGSGPSADVKISPEQHQTSSVNVG